MKFDFTFFENNDGKVHRYSIPISHDKDDEKNEKIVKKFFNDLNNYFFDKLEKNKDKLFSPQN